MPAHDDAPTDAPMLHEDGTIRASDAAWAVDLDAVAEDAAADYRAGRLVAHDDVIAALLDVAMRARREQPPTPLRRPA